MPREREIHMEARHVTLHPLNWITVDSFAKEMGYPSTSAALRRVIDEWFTMKQQEQTARS